MSASINPFDRDQNRVHSSYLTPATAPLAGVSGSIHSELKRHFQDRHYSCAGATHAFTRGDYRFGVYPRMTGAAATAGLCRDLYTYLTEQAASGSQFMTFLAVFTGEPSPDEVTFEQRLWQQLELLDAQSRRFFPWDPTVADDPQSPKFCFSFGGKAFFIVGLHPHASRPARRFPYDTLAFNLHSQFEALRQDGRFEGIKAATRRKELALHGSLNPMLADYGEGAEAPQYSGRQVGREWQCPFHH